MFKKLALFSIMSLVIAGTSIIPINQAQADPGTIVDIVVGNPDFSSLVDAVVSQDLIDALSSEGPFTVFAPTNSAFDNLPPFIVKALEHNPELLTDILLYHVVGENLLAEDVLSRNRITTLEGGKIKPTLHGDTAMINGATIIATDIIASNGTIHVIDSVLAPKHIIRAAFRYELDRLRQEIADLRELFRSII